jgi:hypothetical protein
MRLTPANRSPSGRFDPYRSPKRSARFPVRSRTKRFENLFLVIEISLLLVLVSGVPAWDPASWAAPSGPAPLATGSFAFGAAGDFGFSSDGQAVMTAMGRSGLDFVIILGDFSYGDTSEENWCSFFESHVGDGRVVLITGNHDDG